MKLGTSLVLTLALVAMCSAVPALAETPIANATAVVGNTTAVVGNSTAVSGNATDASALNNPIDFLAAKQAEEAAVKAKLAEEEKKKAEDAKKEAADLAFAKATGTHPKTNIPAVPKRAPLVPVKAQDSKPPAPRAASPQEKELELARSQVETAVHEAHNLAKKVTESETHLRLTKSELEMKNHQLSEAQKQLEKSRARKRELALELAAAKATKNLHFALAENGLAPASQATTPQQRAKPVAPPALPKSVETTLRLNLNISTLNVTEFKKQFVADLANVLNVSPARLDITKVKGVQVPVEAAVAASFIELDETMEVDEASADIEAALDADLKAEEEADMAAEKESFIDASLETANPGNMEADDIHVFSEADAEFEAGISHAAQDAFVLAEEEAQAEAEAYHAHEKEQRRIMEQDEIRKRIEAIRIRALIQSKVFNTTTPAANATANSTAANATKPAVPTNTTKPVKPRRKAPKAAVYRAAVMVGIKIYPGQGPASDAVFHHLENQLRNPTSPLRTVPGTSYIDASFKPTPKVITHPKGSLEELASHQTPKPKQGETPLIRAVVLPYVPPNVTIASKPVWLAMEGQFQVPEYQVVQAPGPIVAPEIL